MKHEMIVSGYTTPDAEKQVDPFLRHLLGKFTKDLSEVDNLLFEYTARAGLPDLYLAEYDDQTYTLTTPEGDGKGISVSFGRPPRSARDWERLRRMHSLAISIGMEID